MYKIILHPYEPSGHVPQCPFTVEDVQAHRTRNKAFATRDYLREKAKFGLGTTGLEFYEALQQATSRTRFSKFVSGRYLEPLTNDISATDAHKKIKYKIHKFFRHACNLKYFFILEQDASLHRGMLAFHFHYLVTAPIPHPGQFDRLPQIIRLNYDTLGRLIKVDQFHDPEFEMPPSNHRTELIRDPFEILLYKKTKGTILDHTSNLNRVNSVKIEDIYNQAQLTDYLLKKLTKPGVDLLVDVANSDIVFTGVS
jgi:hypothetical protein